MLTRVADEKLANVPQMEGLRKELLEDAVRFYEAFLEQNRDNKLLRLETAKAQRRLSQILYYLGHYRAWKISAARRLPASRVCRRRTHPGGRPR